MVAQHSEDWVTGRGWSSPGTACHARRLLAAFPMKPGAVSTVHVVVMWASVSIAKLVIVSS